MIRSVRLCSDLLNDPRVQLLPSDIFRERFVRAIRGEKNEFAPHVRFGPARLCWVTWAVIRNAVFRRDNFTCRYCGMRGGRLECDHVIPLARGGCNDDSNLVTACRRCNRKKSTKTI